MQSDETSKDMQPETPTLADYSLIRKGTVNKRKNEDTSEAVEQKEMFKKRSQDQRFLCHYCLDHRFDTLYNRPDKRRTSKKTTYKAKDNDSELRGFDSSFGSEEELKIHLAMKHSEIYFPCFWCSEYFQTANRLLQHVGKHFQTHNTFCPEQSKPVASPPGDKLQPEDKFDSLRLGRMNPKAPFGCRECHRTFKTYTSMCFHRRMEHNSFAGKVKNFRKVSSAKEEERNEIAFFANIKANVADNLANYIDGKLPSQQQPTFEDCLQNNIGQDENIFDLDCSNLCTKSSVNFKVKCLHLCTCAEDQLKTIKPLRDITQSHKSPETAPEERRRGGRKGTKCVKTK